MGVCWSTTRTGRLSDCCCWWVLRLMAPSTSVSGSITRSPTYSESTIKKTKRIIRQFYQGKSKRSRIAISIPQCTGDAARGRAHQQSVRRRCLIWVFGWVGRRSCSRQASLLFAGKLWIRIHLCVDIVRRSNYGGDEFNNRSIQTQLKRQEPAHRGTHRGDGNEI